jgi:ribosomal protein S18 acetylase RimI-like enzyme
MANENRRYKQITYRPLTISDISEVMKLHARLIPSAGARMGQPYLRILYETLFEHPTTHLTLGAYESNHIVGFISATNNFPATENFLNKRIFTLIPIILFGLLRLQYSWKDLVSHAAVDTKIKQLWNETTVYIVTIAVDPRVQRQGVATQLIRRVRNLWKTKTLLTDTLQTNVAAQHFYEKFGFVPFKSVADSIIFRLPNRS